MRPFASTISLEAARRLLRDHLRPITRIERVGLLAAAGRVAASEVISAIDVPAFDRAAMDGYAVVASDTAAATVAVPARLRLLDRIYTGQPSPATVIPGTCAEIATGAPMPEGADAVVMVEETAAEGDQVQVRSAVAPGRNVGRRAADIKTGDPVVRQGEPLTPGRIGALAAIGRPEADVYARPRVAILSTGNEVVEPGTALSPGQVYDVNRFTLAGIVRSHGGTAAPHKAALDTLAALEEALDACAGADLIVFSGGSSVGSRDLVTDLIAARGEMIFHGIAVKPGKPTAFAMVGGVPFFGMPGNPASCLSNAYVLLIPFLRALARLPTLEARSVRMPLGRRIGSNASGRHQFYTVSLRDGVAYPAFKGSGDITSLSQADGYIEIPADQSVVDEGAVVEVTLF
jgi:molybdenum cofactor synthesis domain-containing protein